jgi:hypothetical protein
VNPHPRPMQPRSYAMSTAPRARGGGRTPKPNPRYSDGVPPPMTAAQRRIAEMERKADDEEEEMMEEMRAERDELSLDEPPPLPEHLRKYYGLLPSPTAPRTQPSMPSLPSPSLQERSNRSNASISSNPARNSPAISLRSPPSTPASASTKRKKRAASVVQPQVTTEVSTQAPTQVYDEDVNVSVRGPSQEGDGKKERKRSSGIALLTVDQTLYVLERRYGADDLQPYFASTDPKMQSAGWKRIIEEVKEKFHVDVTNRQLYDMCNQKKTKFKQRLTLARQSGEAALAPWPFHETLDRLLSSSHSVKRVHTQESGVPVDSSSSAAQSAGSGSLRPAPKKKQRSSDSTSLSDALKAAVAELNVHTSAELDLHMRMMFRIMGGGKGQFGELLDDIKDERAREQAPVTQQRSEPERDAESVENLEERQSLTEEAEAHFRAEGDPAAVSNDALLE